MLGVAGCKDAETPAASPLPALGTKLDETSVSGISSGAYMAGQFQMAHAKIVIGAGIIAGGPYGCSESIFAGAIPGPGTSFLNLSKAVNGCMLDLLGVWGVADGAALAQKAQRRAEKGEIDPVADVINDRVYLFSGTSDRTVVPSIVAHAQDFYLKLGVPQAHIKFVKDFPAGHAFVTDDQGAACELTDKPFIVDCDYDQAGDLLDQIYGELHPRSETPTGDYIVFDQRPFGATGTDGGLADTGVVYIPKACQTSGDCRVHVAYHGCEQNRESVGDAFIKESGFARWADTNQLVILFPQVATTALNPQACWDWWGYTGSEFLTRDAPQIAAVNKMLNVLHGRAGGA
jgi:hypothetical protein